MRSFVSNITKLNLQGHINNTDVAQKTMVENLSGYQLIETLHFGHKTVIYRGRRETDNTSVIVKTLVGKHPSLEEIARLRHEYQIIEPLQIPGVVKPYELKNYQHGLALVLEDIPGCLLKEVIANQTTSLMTFLRVAINLAHTLGELHAQKIIHKDIKPHNILINPDSGEVKIIDFSISSRLNQENPILSNPNLLEGTLAYMSPEQTGRMNRAIDYRTDFYSLGVTLYEMLTGTLPFHAVDPMELVHCHIAKTPAAPCRETMCRVLGEVPEAISAIILKLLAKTAEERYQSAWGLKADLEECLLGLQTKGKIKNFVPGRRDKSGQFLIPQALYGRETEVKTLMSAFDRVASGSSELMLVSGYSGIGKTSVVNEVHKPIVAARGYFIAGKFDQFKRNIPYASLIQAFQSLVQQLLTESEAQIQAWKEKLLTALGENGQVIIDVIPEVELIIGSQPPVAQLGALESQNRFHRVFGKFIGVFTTQEHPLVVFLDDLQWADSGSLNLIELLMTDSDRHYLFLIGAYRDNEVSPTHPLIMTLDKIQTAGAVVNNIVLSSLQLTDVEGLISDTLNHVESSRPLAELLFHKTGGNPFFLTQLLKTLHQEDLLTYNFQFGVWQWNLQHIQAIGITDLNVVELTARNIRKLSLETQKVLKLAACIGNTFNLDVLAIVNEASPLTTATQLWSALQAGLILPLSQDYKIPLAFGQEEAEEITLTDVKVDYKFLHDRVQQAAYSLIPDQQKKATHLKIGQLLLQNTTPETRKENIFGLVNQLNYGTDLLTSESAKYELAQLNLIAGQKAKAATAYESAVRYLTTGLELLPVDHWDNQYHLSLELYVEAVQAEYLNSNIERATILAEVILQRAKTLLDRVKIYQIQIQFYIDQIEIAKAIDLALQVLENLGVSLVPLPNQQESRLPLPQLENLDGLPIMTDPYQLAALNILMLIIPPTFIAAPNIYVQAVLTMVNLCHHFGYSEIAAFVYCQYGLVLSGVMGDIEAGYQSGNIALKLLNKFKDNKLKCRIFMVFNTFIRPWKEHINATKNPMREGFLSGVEIGDIGWACYNASNYCDHIFFSGESLELVASEQAKYLDFIIKNKQPLCIYCIHPFKRTALKLLGTAEEKYLLNGKIVDDEIVLQDLIVSQNYMCTFTLYVSRVLLAYLFKDYSTAIANAESALEYAGSAINQVVTATHNFFYSLALLAVVANLSAQEQENALSRVNKNQELMQKWAVNSPGNFQHKYDLVAAEKARVLRQYEQAAEYYDQAIKGANQQGYIQEEALANELAAEFYFSLGKEKIAKIYMTDAYYAYIRWGAVTKVKDLEARYPQLIMQSVNIQQPETDYQKITQTNSTTTGSTHLLDFMTVMKAAQILSEEMVLTHLLEKMIKIVIENAGAQQGYFITKHENQWMLEAVGMVEDQEVRVVIHSKEKTDLLLLPVALFNYVERTRDNLVLDDAVNDSRFAADVYITIHQAKSILCLPLIHSGQFTGLLYLENNLITGAFTPDRVNVLNLLSAQISIAIDNARLYTNLQTYSQQLEAKSLELEAKNAALQASEMREREKAEQLTQSLHKLQQTQAQLVQTEKMSSLGQLVAGVAHEINNPVNFISGNLNHANSYTQDLLGLLALYRKHYPSPHPEILEETEAIDLEFMVEDLPKLLSSMWVGAERIQKIVASLRTFSRMDEAEIKAVNIHEGIDSTLMILQHRFKAKSDRPAIEVIKYYGNLPQVECYAGQLNQVFMNVLSNAIDSLESRWTIDTSEESLMKKPDQKTTLTITIYTAQIDADQIEVRIADNGLGIPESIQHRLFNPFFTTKPVGKGTGMGLSISYQIVTEKHGGSLSCTSEPGKGAEFIIRVPICQSVSKNFAVSA